MSGRDGGSKARNSGGRKEEELEHLPRIPSKFYSRTFQFDSEFLVRFVLHAHVT